MATMCEDGDFILTPEELNYLSSLDERDFILTPEELNYLSSLDERDALAMFAQQDEDGAHAFVDVLEDGNLLIDGDSSVMKRGKELDLVNASLGGVFDVDHLFEEDLPKLWPQTELEGSSDENQLECVFDVPMFTSEGLLADGQVRMKETEACCLGEFGRLLAEEKAPSLDGLLDEGLLSHGQARMEETEACCLDEFGGLLAEEKAPSLDGLLARDSEAHILDNDANLVNFCLPIQEKKDEWVNASGNTIVLGNDMPCTYQSGWQPWGQQATQEMAANSLPPLSASPWEQQHAITSMAPVSTFTWQQQAWLLLPPVSTSTWEQQAPQQMAAPSMKKRKAEHKKTIPNQKIDKAAMPHLVCPRCFSDNTRFDYNNNYSLNQPRYKCMSCDRHWTVGGKIRKSGGRRRKKAKRKSANIEDID